MIFGLNTTCDISKLSQITYNNFEISLVVFMPNIITNHAITYTTTTPTTTTPTTTTTTTTTNNNTNSNNRQNLG